MAILIFILGIIAGVFINFCSDNLPLSRQLSQPICINCQEKIPWKAFLIFKRCPKCNFRRRVRVYVVQILIPILFLYVWFFPTETAGSWVAMGLISYFAIVFIIDFEYREILNLISLVGVVLGAISGTLMHGLVQTLIGGLAAFLIMLMLYYFGILFSNYMAKHLNKESEVALGFGDVYLSGILGLVLGWPGIIAGLLVAILLGGIVSGLILFIGWVKKDYQSMTAIPYAPFLIIGSLFLLLRPH